MIRRFLLIILPEKLVVTSGKKNVINLTRWPLGEHTEDDRTALGHCEPARTLDAIEDRLLVDRATDDDFNECPSDKGHSLLY